MQNTTEQHLTPAELRKLKNNRTGLLLFQLSWILVFVCLIVVNLLMRANYPSWPPPGVEHLGIGLPLVATAALFISSVVAHQAYTALKQERMSVFFARWPLIVGLGLVFIVIMAFEWISVPVTGQYSTLFRVMTGFHGLHALVIGAYLWRVYRFAKAGVYGPRNFWAVEAGVKLWDFVTVAWLLFFSVLYIL